MTISEKYQRSRTPTSASALPRMTASCPPVTCAALRKSLPSSLLKNSMVKTTALTATASSPAHTPPPANTRGTNPCANVGSISATTSATSNSSAKTSTASIPSLTTPSNPTITSLPCAKAGAGLVGKKCSITPLSSTSRSSLKFPSPHRFPPSTTISATKTASLLTGLPPTSACRGQTPSEPLARLAATTRQAAPLLRRFRHPQPRRLPHQQRRPARCRERI